MAIGGMSMDEIRCFRTHASMVAAVRSRSGTGPKLSNPDIGSRAKLVNCTI